MLDIRQSKEEQDMVSPCKQFWSRGTYWQPWSVIQDLFLCKFFFFSVKKYDYLELTSCTQFKWSQVFSNIWGIIVRSQSNMCLFLSIRPGLVREAYLSSGSHLLRVFAFGSAASWMDRRWVICRSFMSSPFQRCRLAFKAFTSAQSLKR